MTNTTLIALASRLAHEIHLLRPLLPTYIHLLASAIFPIFIAAHASLARPSSAAPRKLKKDIDDTELDDEDEPVQKLESLTPSDAILFPVLAGATLASLYFILKWLQDPAWLNWLLGLYFAQLGLFFGFKFVKDTFTLLRSVIFPTTYSWKGQVYCVDTKSHNFTSTNQPSARRLSPLPGFLGALPFPAFLNNKLWTMRSYLYTRKRLTINLDSIFKYSTFLSLLDPLSLLLSTAITAYHTFIAKPWPLTNFLGISFCYSALQYTSPTTAWTGTLILAALFVYDIYFVFFTPMMVTVATKLDIPIKLLFPRPDGCIYPLGVEDTSEEMAKYLLCKKKGSAMAMLGLGDIVVPGMVIAFALRFDLYLHYRRLQNKEGRKEVWKSATGAWGERFWTRLPQGVDAEHSQERISATGIQEEEVSTATATSIDDATASLTAAKQRTSPPTVPSTSLTSTSAPDSRSPPSPISALQARSFAKPYFSATLLGYLAGLISTILSMQVMGRAQPALLYLVPGVLGALWGFAFWRGEGRMLWGFSEDEGKEEKGKGKEEKQKDGKVEGEKEGQGKKSKKGLVEGEIEGEVEGQKGDQGALEAEAEG